MHYIHMYYVLDVCSTHTYRAMSRLGIGMHLQPYAIRYIYATRYMYAIRYTLYVCYTLYEIRNTKYFVLRAVCPFCLKQGGSRHSLGDATS